MLLIIQKVQEGSSNIKDDITKKEQKKLTYRFDKIYGFFILNQEKLIGVTFANFLYYKNVTSKACYYVHEFFFFFFSIHMIIYQMD